MGEHNSLRSSEIQKYQALFQDHYTRAWQRVSAWKQATEVENSKEIGCEYFITVSSQLLLPSVVCDCGGKTLRSSQLEVLKQKDRMGGLADGGWFSHRSRDWKPQVSTPALPSQPCLADGCFLPVCLCTWVNAPW